VARGVSAHHRGRRRGLIRHGKLLANLHIRVSQDLALGASAGSVRSWNHLCRLFTSTCVRPGVDWDLASFIQKKGESLREFIQRFCNKKNIIPEVDDKSIDMFFKKGLRNSSLIRKLTMKNPRTSKEMFAIAKKYALAEEATLDTREHKESGHTDQPSSSKGHDKKRKADRGGMTTTPQGVPAQAE
jgi:hypothetical protein